MGGPRRRHFVRKKKDRIADMMEIPGQSRDRRNLKL